MRKIMQRFVWVAVVALLAIFPVPELLMAGGEMDQADSFFEKGTFEGYDGAIVLYQQILDRDSDNFEAAWKCARAHQWAADLAKSRQVKGWKKMCVRHGKAGMALAERAVRLNPERVEGHYYRGCTAAACADGASVFTVIRENLIDIIEESLSTAYEIDRTFDHGGVMQALGRLYYALPWPKKDLDKSLAYLQENNKLFPDDPCGLVFLAETLLAADGDKANKEAVKLLEASVAAAARFGPAVVEIYGGMAEKQLEELTSR